METGIIAIYCLLDDYILSINAEDWPNVKLSTAEVMLIFVVSMRYFYGNIDTARKFLAEHGYIRHLLSKSALNRRIHHIPGDWWEGVFEFIQRMKNKEITCFEYILDAFPVSVCRNIRIRSSRIYQGEEFRGYNKSKREYFYGLKVTVITTREGCPFRIILCPGREHDWSSLQTDEKGFTSR